jgi:hypothetical protein
MKTALPTACLLALLPGAPTTFAQSQPSVSPAITEDALRFLSAPRWYFNYTVTIKLSGTSGGHNEQSERVMSGRMLLGLRSQGPSLSVISGDAKPPDLTSQLAAQQAAALKALGANPDPQAILAAVSQGLSSVTPAQVDLANAQFDAYVNNWANWISGLNIDETKSDEENERDLVRVRFDNIKVNERYRWQMNGPGGAGGYDRGAAQGSGISTYHNEPAFEIDGANRKYKILFPVHFGDSLTTLDAFRGASEHNIGTIHYQRFEIKTGLHSGEQPITQITPELKFIEGSLPASFGTISGRSVHSIVAGNLPGTLMIDYTVSPNPPIPVELWIDPPADYARWLPTADKDEATAGDVIPIRIVLQKPGGGPPQFKPRRFEFFLIDTSQEKGVCLNWPPPAAGTSAANTPPPFDLQFESSQNRDMFVHDEGQRLVDTAPDKLERTVNVSCFDYGAYGEFAVHAELENGQLVKGLVRGTTDQERLNLPARKDGSKIATAFLDQHGVSNLADDDDSENDPVGDTFKGDGLSLYEEYRGFMVGDTWTPGAPKKKDVFVINEMRGHPGVVAGVKLFERLTSLEVHDLLRDNQVQADGRINFSRTSAPHVVDQHAIRIEAGEWVLFGNTAARVTGNVGTPGTAKTVSVPPDLALAAGGAYMASTVAHEMLHACNVYHHGERDRRMRWFYRPGEGQIYEEGFAAGAGHPVPITVKRENGRVIAPSVFFPPGETEQTIWLGMKHGQHSGAEQCVMRYDTALAYPSSRDPIVRYLTEGEPVGTQICRSPAGTGVNASGRSPESRYETAATAPNGGFNADGTHQVINDRGNCVGQIRVNDKDREPRR